MAFRYLSLILKIFLNFRINFTLKESLSSLDKYIFISLENPIYFCVLCVMAVVTVCMMRMCMFMNILHEEAELQS